MPILINHKSALKLAFDLAPLDPDSILQSLETIGDIIVRDHVNLGVTRDEAFDVARRFCSATLAECIKLRDDSPQVMH